MKKVTMIICTLCVVLGLLLVGCSQLIDEVTPATLDQDAISYTLTANVGTQADYEGYGNLRKASSLSRRVDATHRINILAFSQMIETDSLEYSNIKESVLFNLAQSEQTKEYVFGETGLLTTILPIIGVGGIGSVLIKRPGDVSAKESAEKVKKAGMMDPEIFAKVEV